MKASHWSRRAKVTSGLGEDLHDVVHRRVDPVPALAERPGIVAPGNGVIFFIQTL